MALAVMGRPGPATISLTAAASANGVGRSFGHLIGLRVGAAMVLVAVATGITATLSAVPAMAAAFASARLADAATTDAAAKVAVLSVVIVLIVGAWLIAGACLASMLRDPVRARVINTALAAALVGATAFAALR